MEIRIDTTVIQIKNKKKNKIKIIYTYAKNPLTQTPIVMRFLINYAELTLVLV